MGVSGLLPYHASLRALGQLLDAEGASFLTLCEIHGGFLLQSLAGGDPCAVTSHVLPYADVLALVEAWEPATGSPRPWRVRFWPRGGRGRAAGQRPPRGYTAGLQALGHALDRRQARAVTIAALDAALQVEYTVARAASVFRDGQRVVAPGRYMQHYTAAQLEAAVQACTAQIAETVRRAGLHLAANPADIRACLAGAAALEAGGDRAEAERLYRQAVALVPSLREAHYHLARLAFRRGDLAGALHHLRPATTAETGDGRPFYLLGRLHERRREPVAAAWAWEQALARDPENALYAFALERLRETGGGAQTGEASHGAHSAREKENVYLDRTETREVDGAALAPAASYAAPAPLPQTYGVRAGLPAPHSGPAYVPAAHSVAPCADQALGDSGGQGSAALDALPGAASGGGLPILGLAAAGEWERPAWPSLHVPVDSAAVAAALPLAAAHLVDVLPQCAAKPSDPHDGQAGAGEDATHRPAMDVERSLADTGVAP